VSILLSAFVLLLIPFAVVAGVALRYGAESRPFWDERPYDGRPNL
jgi:hypothetical protein